jgi:hypothetical protein
MVVTPDDHFAAVYQGAAKFAFGSGVLGRRIRKRLFDGNGFPSPLTGSFGRTPAVTGNCPYVCIGSFAHCRIFESGRSAAILLASLVEILP